MSENLEETFTEAIPGQVPGETLTEQASAPVPPMSQEPESVVYCKKPFYKLAWFWIAMVLAVISLCCLVVAGGALVFGRRASRSGMTDMRMQDSMSMQSGRGMRNGSKMNCPKGSDCGDMGSQESTSGSGISRGYKGQM